MIDAAFELRTERLRLRPYRLEDLDAFHAIVGDPETMRFYPEPFSVDAARDWIERVRSRYEELGFGLLIVEEAGGITTRFDATPVDPFKGQVVATNPALLAPILDVINRVYGPADLTS